MKLARPYRRAPLEIATLLAAKLVRDAGGDGADVAVEAAEVAPPGFVNLRLRPTPSRGWSTAILGEPAAWGRVAPDPAARRSTSSSSRPTRPGR